MKQPILSLSCWIGGFLFFFGLVIALFLAANGAPDFRPSRSQIKRMISKEEVAEKAKEVKPILEAIYHFKNEWGVWPLDFEELEMPGKTKNDFLGLEYKRDTDGWTYTSYRLFPLVMVYYCYKERIGWAGYDGEFEVDIKEFQPQVKAKPLNNEQLSQKLRILSKKRLKSHPDDLGHYQGFVSLFYKLEDYERACQLCDIVIHRWPEHWWGHLAKAVILQKQEKFEQGEAIMKQHFVKDSTFTSAYLMHYFYCQSGESKKGFETLRTGLDHSYVHLTDGEKDIGGLVGAMDSYFPSRAAWEAYENKEYDLAFAISSVYNKRRREKAFNENCYFNCIMTACCVAKGEFERAKHFLSRARKSHIHQRLTKEMAALEKAIVNQNRKFRYESRDVQNEFRVFVNYQ